MPDDEEFEQEEQLALLTEPGRLGDFSVRTVLEYAAAKLARFCRLRYFLMAVRTRVDDRDYQFNAKSGGEADYIEVPIGEPDNYVIEEGEYVTGVEIDPELKELISYLELREVPSEEPEGLSKKSWEALKNDWALLGKTLEDLRDAAEFVKQFTKDQEEWRRYENDPETYKERHTEGDKKFKEPRKPEYSTHEQSVLDSRWELIARLLRLRFPVWFYQVVGEEELEAIAKAIAEGKKGDVGDWLVYKSVKVTKRDETLFEGRYYLQLPDDSGALPSRLIQTTSTLPVLASDLWDPRYVGACGTLLPGEDEALITVVGPDQQAANIRALSADEAEEALITADKKRLQKVRPQFKPGNMYLLTEELTDTTAQLFRGPWHMMYKGLIDRAMHRLVILQKQNPFKLVKYPMAGASPKGPKRDEKAEYYWRDALYRKAILLKNKSNRVNKKDKRSKLPDGLYYDRATNSYFVQIGKLDENGLGILAHNEVERMCRDAESVYRYWMVALVTEAMGTGDYDKWDLVARYGEHGLRTASTWLTAELTDPTLKDWYRGGRFRTAAEYNKAVRTRQYEALHAEMQAAGVDFWKEADFESKYEKWVGQANDFIDRRFDRSYASEQYRFRTDLSKEYGAHDKKSVRSKAKANIRLSGKSMYVIALPKVRWVWVPDARGGGKWQLKVNWSSFDYFAEGVEAMRDWIRMLAEWKYSKNANRVMASMKFDDKTALSLANQDWGGIWNPIESRHDWMFWLLYCIAQKRAPVPELFEDVPYPKRKKGESKDDWVVRYTQFWHRVEARVAIMGWAWYDRHPNDEMPHDGALRVLTAQKWADWIEMILTARKLNTLQGEGLIPELDDLLKDYTSRERNYYNESVWMESDEGATRDPQAVWGYMRGILRPNIISILNYRYAGAYRDCPDIRLKYTDIHSETATKLRDQVKEMWQNASVRELIVRITKIWADAQAENVIHIRPHYIKVLHGLPKGVLNNPEFHKFIQGLNKRSDERVEFWAAHLSNGSGTWTGKRALDYAFVHRVIGEGYGTGRGLTSKQVQQLQDKLGFMAWMNQQYDKAVALTRGLVFNAKAATNVMEEQYKAIASAIAGGMYPPVVRNVMDALGKSKLIKIEYFFPADDEDVLKPVERVEAHFKEEEISRIGPRMVEAVEKGTLFDELEAA